MTTAQKLSTTSRRTRKKRPYGSSTKPKIRSDLLLDKTQARLEDVQREIDGAQAEAQGRRNLDRSEHLALRNTLEFVREQEARERDDKILMHRPRHAEPLDNVDTHQTRACRGPATAPEGRADS